ncbi:MAG: hypothetical protein ACLQOZ_06030 [Acidimicrobiales bacterium]
MDEISHLDDRKTLRHNAMVQIGPERRQRLCETVRVTLHIADQCEASDFDVRRQECSIWQG